jgi:hypothetical protein
VCVDVADVRQRKSRLSNSRLHRSTGAITVLQRSCDVAAVTTETIAANFSVNPGTTFLGVLVLLHRIIGYPCLQTHLATVIVPRGLGHQPPRP